MSEIKKNPRIENFCILILDIMKKKLSQFVDLSNKNPYKTVFFFYFFETPLNFYNKWLYKIPTVPVFAFNDKKKVSHF